MAYIEYLSWKENGRLVHSPGSNFFIEPDGTHVEGEYQGSKFDGSPFKRRLIIARYVAMTPGEAKRNGRNIKLRPDWDRVKIDVMRYFVHGKFTDHEECAEWLDGTRNSLIVEGNYWHDNFWGNCHCIKCPKIGKNWLGKILMDTRAELRGEIVRAPTRVAS